MNDIGFRHRWVDVGRTAEPAIDATFADLELTVDDAPALRVYHKGAQTMRSDSLLPLYPLAEWIVANWWQLLNEPESPDRGGTEVDYLSRHSFASVSDGFAYPDVRVVPEAEVVRVEWRQHSTKFQNVEYASSGSVHVRRVQVEQVLTDLVESVLSRLDAQGVSDTWLHKEWNAVNRDSDEEREFCVAAAYLGLDPYDVDKATAGTVTKAWNTLPVSLRPHVFQAASLSVLAQATHWVTSGLQRVTDSTTADGAWDKLRSALPSGDASAYPWAEGYRLARALAGLIGLGSKHPIDLDGYPDFPNVGAGEAPVASLEAVVGAGRRGAPCYYAVTRTRTANRFLKARAFYEFLSSSPGQAALVSTAVTARQKASRAFAAELLAPSAFLRERIASDIATESEIERLATELDVSPLVVARQILNHGIASVPQLSGTLEV